MASNLAKLAYEISLAKGATPNFTGLAKAVTDGAMNIVDANMEAAKMYESQREALDTTGLSEEAISALNPKLQGLKSEYFQASKDARNLFLSSDQRQAAVDKMNNINFQIKGLGDYTDQIKDLKTRAKQLSENYSASTTAPQSGLTSDLVSGEFWKDVVIENGRMMYKPTGEEGVDVMDLKLGPESSERIPTAITDLQVAVQDHVSKGGKYEGAYKNQVENKLAELFSDLQESTAFAYDGFRFQGEDMKFINNYIDMINDGKQVDPKNRELQKEAYKTADLRNPLFSYYKDTFKTIGANAEDAYDRKLREEDQRKVNLYQKQVDIRTAAAAKPPQTTMSPQEIAEAIQRRDTVPAGDGFTYRYSPADKVYSLYNKSGVQIKEGEEGEYRVALTPSELAGSLKDVGSIYESLIQQQQVKNIMNSTGYSEDKAKQLLGYMGSLGGPTDLPVMPKK